MDTTMNEEIAICDVREVHIVSGITPDDVEGILDMAAASGIFSSDIMMSAEGMAWDSAYGGGNESHTFLKATINESGQHRTVGFICFGPIPHWPGNYELYGIAIESEFQRLGIGSGLVAEMRRQITYNNGKQIFLETGADRLFEKARLFYEANEFIHEYRFHKQFIPTDGGIVYRFEIDVKDANEQYQ